MGLVEIARDEVKRERQIWDHAPADASMEAWQAWDEHAKGIFQGIGACNVAVAEAWPAWNECAMAIFRGVESQCLQCRRRSMFALGHKC